MSYQSTLEEGSPMVLADFAAADTPKSEKNKSLGLTSVLVLSLALASFLAGRASSGSTAATATAYINNADCMFSLSRVQDVCDYDTYSCLYGYADGTGRKEDMEGCPETRSSHFCSKFRDDAIEDCAQDQEYDREHDYFDDDDYFSLPH